MSNQNLREAAQRLLSEWTSKGFSEERFDRLMNVLESVLARPDDKAQPVDCFPNFAPPPPTERERGYTDRETAVISFCLMQMCDLSDKDWRDHGFRRSTFDAAHRKFVGGRTFAPAAASRASHG